jgi:2-amino-4-hydroxy-6-hydroxymethyldihydropteridine diphosphokinase
MHRAYLSLGSNLEAQRHLPFALRALRERFGYVLCSPVYITPAVGFAGPDFWNLACGLDCTLTIEALHRALRAIEDAALRDRSQARFSSRTLDIDILFFDDLIHRGADHLQVPRPELQHAFVLKPACDIAPDYAVPGDGRRLATMWQAHPEFHALRWYEGFRLD